MKNKKLITLIIILSLVAAVLIGRAILFPPSPLKVIQTNPMPGQTISSSLEKITFIFNKDISSKNFTLSTEPKIEYKLEKDNQTLYLKLTKPLNPNTRYKINLKDDYKLSFSLIFFTNPSSFQQEEKTGRGNPEAFKETSQEILEKYPLFNQTPKETKDWVADYLAPRKLIVIYNPDREIQTIKNEVFIWMEDEGVNPQTHEFVWQEKQ